MMIESFVYYSYIFTDIALLVLIRVVELSQVLVDVLTFILLARLVMMIILQFIEYYS